MKKGDIVELKIDKYAFEGKGISRIKKDAEDTEANYVVFVENSFPGDVVNARILKVKKSFAEAKTVEVLKHSEYRGKAACRYFTICGGCKQQDIDYNIQVKYKQDQVNEVLNKIGGFSNYIAEDIIPAEETFYYRNKMEFSFSDKRWLTTEEISSGENIDRSFALGLHIPGIFDKVIDIDECFLQSEISNGIVNLTRDFFKERKIPVYNIYEQAGYLRNLIIREAKKTHDLMVNLVTFEDKEDLMKEYTSALLNKFPRITTIINNISRKRSSVATGDYEKVYYGNGYITDYIGDKKFIVSANSFFQTNTIQAEKLYNTIKDFAGFGENDIVYDLYSGAGTITIYISGNSRKVYGFETVEAAINDAKVNAKLNSAEDVYFLTADLNKSFLPIAAQNELPAPDIIITDPPRSGMHQNIVNDVLSLAPEKVVYVSCNPATQARDIKLLSEKYDLIKIRPVDMFPHTYHIENVALLIKKK
jgi:23S rRNA (uracil1939-C5)-methyltransferase